mgnify:CR=1 FL=1
MYVYCSECSLGFDGDYEGQCPTCLRYYEFCDVGYEDGNGEYISCCDIEWEE